MGNPSEHGTAGTSGPGNPAGETRFSPGAVLFDRYSIVREIGRGGMGVVLLAWDSELETEMALKLIPELLIHDHEALDDLKQEVLRGMTLTHPGIVRTHGLVKDDSTAAILMEYVDGGTFHDFKRLQEGGCFDPSELLPWIEQLCPALDYAHFECQVAHRDLKPRNLMYTLAGRIKIADFGISSNLGDAMTRATMARPSSGTPAYMSPQQIMGSRPSHLDDIYSLGATIYELLTGRPPFHKGEVVYQVLERDAIPMNAKREELGVTGKHPIPAHWEQAVAACLAKKPEARPQSAGELLAWLRRPADVGFAPPAAAEEVIQVKTRARRRRSAAPWAGLAIAALLIAAAAMALKFSAPSGRPVVADEQGVSLAVSTPAALPGGEVGLVYHLQMEAAGGLPPYQWSLASGNLPRGITLDEHGVLSGVPEEAGTNRFDIIISDKTSHQALRSHEFRVAPAKMEQVPETENDNPAPEELRIAPSPTLPRAVSGVPYRAELKAEGGSGPMEWSVASGSLPDGLGISPDGVISGVPLQPGPAACSVKVKDATGAESILDLSFEIDPPAPAKPLEEKTELAASKEEPFVNTLGMRFVPAGTDGVFFSIWLTRVRDYSAFATATKRASGRMLSIEKGGKAELKAIGHTWDNPGFNQTDDHPVCGVSWVDARDFCEWLTTTEREAGVLPAHLQYRLPKDSEWLRALGIEDPGNRPQFPWGIGSPPGLRCNLAGEEIRIDEIPRDWKNILGFRDNAPFPSPVDHFPPNQFGLHDSFGNLWQILDDVTNSGSKRRLLRGGSWLSHDPAELKLDAKFDRIETGRGVDAGFRCVIAPNPG